MRFTCFFTGKFWAFTKCAGVKHLTNIMSGVGISRLVLVLMEAWLDGMRRFCSEGQSAECFKLWAGEATYDWRLPLGLWRANPASIWPYLHGGKVGFGDRSSDLGVLRFANIWPHLCWELLVKDTFSLFSERGASLSLWSVDCWIAEFCN